jgi:hypothetical protein
MALHSATPKSEKMNGPKFVTRAGDRLPLWAAEDAIFADRQSHLEF